MNKTVIASFLSFAFISTATAAAPTAQLMNISGPVLVDQGKGFVRVSSKVDLPAGSRVLVSKGGGATLAYADGCKLALAVNSITTVASKNGCNAQEQVAAQNVGDLKFENGVWYAVTAVVGGVAIWAVADSVSNNNNNDGVGGEPVSPL